MNGTCSMRAILSQSQPCFGFFGHICSKCLCIRMTNCHCHWQSCKSISNIALMCVCVFFANFFQFDNAMLIKINFINGYYIGVHVFVFVCVRATPNSVCCLFSSSFSLFCFIFRYLQVIFSSAVFFMTEISASHLTHSLMWTRSSVVIYGLFCHLPRARHSITSISLFVCTLHKSKTNTRHTNRSQNETRCKFVSYY